MLENEESSFQTIAIETRIADSKAAVWPKYTLPEHITQWNFAADTWCCPSASNDLRVGGRYVARMEAKDGSFGFDFEAIYNEVVLFERLGYEMLDRRKALIEFTETDGETVVTIAFDAEHMNPIELQRDGWQAILNNFKKHCERG
ncbi:MAG: SRPBCC family protein [Flavobacteriales bacterium]